MAERNIPAGYLGPGGFQSSSVDEGFLEETVTNATTDLLAGEVVRISANDTVVRAQANVPANVVGLVGVTVNPIPAGGAGSISSNGKTTVLLEAALAPVAGNHLWVSATVPGRATNVEPPLGAYVGMIKDASGYAANGTVVADINPSTESLTVTLSDTYDAGAAAADQTMVLTDAHGGPIIIDASNAGFDAGFAGAYAFEIRKHGLSVTADQRLANPVNGTTWKGINFAASTLQLDAGGAPPTALSFAFFAAPTINGATYTIPTAATVTIAGSPAGTATITNPMALHVSTGQLAIGSPISSTAQLTIQNGTSTMLRLGNSSTSHLYISHGANAASFGSFGATSYISFDSFLNFRVLVDVMIGTATPIVTSRLQVQADKTIASAAGVFDGINFKADAVSITGATPITTATGFNKFAIYAPTYTGNTATCAISQAATVYINAAPIAGANVTIANPYAFWIDAGAFRCDGRVLTSKGANVVSAGNMTLGEDGNVFNITAANAINTIVTARWQLGSIIILHFDSTPTINHAQAGGAGPPAFAGIYLAGSIALVAAAETVLTLCLMYLADGVTLAWQEVARKAA